MYLRKPQNLKPQPKVYSLHFSSLCMVASDIMYEAQQAWIVFGFTVARKHQLLAPRSNIATIILRHWRLPSRSEARWKKQQPESCSNLCFFFWFQTKRSCNEGQTSKVATARFPHANVCLCLNGWMPIWIHGFLVWRWQKMRQCDLSTAFAQWLARCDLLSNSLREMTAGSCLAK